MTEELKQLREAFERWAPPTFSRHTTVDEDGDLSYDDDWMQGAWVAYVEFTQRPAAQPTISTQHGPWLPSRHHEGETYCQRCLTRSVFASNRACDPHIVPAPQQATSARECPECSITHDVGACERDTQQATPVPSDDFDAWWESDGPNTSSPYDAAKSAWHASKGATPEPPATRAQAETTDWRDRLTVNLLRQGAGLIKTQIRALIAHAVDGTEPDSALFTPTPEPVTLGPLAKRNIYDAIRGAYDLGYNDARNARAVPGDSAPGYDGRSVEEDHGGALFNTLNRRLVATPEPVGEVVGTVVRDTLDRNGRPWLGVTWGPGIDLPDGAKLYAVRPAAAPAVPRDVYDALERERDYWRTRARAMLDHADGTCWYWMGNGEDHLESLVNSLPVVIRADQLRDLVVAEREACADIADSWIGIDKSAGEACDEIARDIRARSSKAKGAQMVDQADLLRTADEVCADRVLIAATARAGSTAAMITSSQVKQMITKLHNIAIEFHDNKTLRTRIAREIAPLLASAPEPVLNAIAASLLYRRVSEACYEVNLIGSPMGSIIALRNKLNTLRDELHEFIRSASQEGAPA